MFDYEVCVIGSGPGGQKAAIQAAKLGKKVCVVERMEQVGGVAIHTGTIPSKALRQAILDATGGRDHLAVRGDVKAGRLTIDSLLSSCQRIVATEMEIVRKQLARNGIDLFSGEAVFASENSVNITGATACTTVTADKFVVAVGTEPVRPETVPFDDACILTSDDLLDLKCLPETMIVVGGGVIGTEFASMFARLGVRVTVVSRTKRVLGFLDPQIGEALQYHMRSRGMVLRMGEVLESVEKHDETGKTQVQVKLKSGKMLRADTLLFCGGRKGVTARMNLEAVGLVANARGQLDVDENYQTSNPNIYAVGDVVGFPALASTAMIQGRAAARHLSRRPQEGNLQLYPFGIYSVPEISTIGDNEEELTEKGIPYESGVATYREIARGQLIGDDVGMLKLLFHPDTRKVLGVHIIGTGATELIHIGQAVMALDGDVHYFVDHAFNYPTLAECYRVAALNGINKL